MSNAKSIPITPKRKKNFKDDPGADHFVSGGMSRPSDAGSDTMDRSRNETRASDHAQTSDQSAAVSQAGSNASGAGEGASTYPRAVGEAPETAAPDPSAPQQLAATQIPAVGPKGKKTTDPLGNLWPWFTDSVSEKREKIVNFRFPETLDAQLTVAAKRVGMSKKELAAKAVEDYVRRIFDSEGIAYDRDDM